MISKKSLVKSIAMSPYYFLPIVVAVLNPPSLPFSGLLAPLPPPDTQYRLTHSHSLSDEKCKKEIFGEFQLDLYLN